MCGIFGLFVGPNSTMSRNDWDSALTSLFLLSESRGKEAAGIALANDKEIVVHKDSISANEMMKTADYRTALERGAGDYFKRNDDDRYLGVIGHARLVTNGLQGIDANNQPIWRDDIVIVHNGIVVNVDDLWEKNEGIDPTAEVDSEVIAALMYQYRQQGKSSRDAMVSAFNDVYGETSVALFEAAGKNALLGTNTGSLHYCVSNSGNELFFASEHHICRLLTNGSKAIPAFQGAKIEQVLAGNGLSIALKEIEATRFGFEENLAAPAIEPMLETQRKIEEKSARTEAARESMRRCTKCLLPETMPYISFDADGVCSYCHSYEPWTKRPESDLEEVLSKHRSTDGSPDCVMAFSGGRDSSYGLHLMKEKYGMNPICFTYDWGMVTDLARRNQARLCGKLGVEHIWISADIKAKRANIRRNVLAWLKKPDLGIIPLFMAGDKQMLMYANKTMEQTGLSIMALCTNRYEKTDFKAGFLHVNSTGSTIHKPSSLPMAAKANMLWQYGKRFMVNPRYINRSIPDTASAFLSFYAIEQDYFSLFDFVPWVETEIDEILIGEYDWELAPDAKSSWRIGDGTAPFYNYIYYSVAGFTEADTFRSNQIREGAISREEGMRLAALENEPRWQSIREYTQIINIDFDETIRIIDRIPKLYI